MKFDITYATDSAKGSVKAIDNDTKQVICEKEITRKNTIGYFFCDVAWKQLSISSTQEKEKNQSYKWKISLNY